MSELILKTGRGKSLYRRHPWIFSGAVERVSGNPGVGETVKILSSQGEALGYAAYSPQSSIRARMWNYACQEKVDEAFIANRIKAAIKRRVDQHLLDDDNDSCRLIYAESDEIPGLIVDQYAQVLVAQFLSTGVVRWKEPILEQLKKAAGINSIYERSDVEVRKLEGLSIEKGPLSGQVPEEPVQILENGKKFLADIVNGQKTGFYLDQRDNRRAIQKYTQGRSVLNCFSYTGAFSVYALEGAAEKVVSIDSSASANEMAQRNVSLNKLRIDNNEYITGDVFKELRLLRDKAISFDMIILDPPKFAPTASQVQSAARGYKDINLLAFKLLNPGGILATFSCSGGLDRQLFQKIVADAALDAGVNARILEQLTQGMDHPIALNFPEASYLKGFICRVD